MGTKRRTNFYVFGRILVSLAGILTIVFAILAIVGAAIWGGGAVGFVAWLFGGLGLFGFLLPGLAWFIIAIVCGVLAIVIALGTGFRNVNGIIIGIIVIIIGIFMPGIPAIIAWIGALMYIIDGIA